MEPGICLVSETMSLGFFGANGGELSLPHIHEVINLTVPKDSLEVLKLLYIGAAEITDDSSLSSEESRDDSLMCSPEIICGPDGVEFEV